MKKGTNLKFLTIVERQLLHNFVNIFQDYCFNNLFDIDLLYDESSVTPVFLRVRFFFF